MVDRMPVRSGQAIEGQPGFDHARVAGQPLDLFDTLFRRVSWNEDRCREPRVRNREPVLYDPVVDGPDEGLGEVRVRLSGVAGDCIESEDGQLDSAWVQKLSTQRLVVRTGRPPSCRKGIEPLVHATPRVREGDSWHEEPETSGPRSKVGRASRAGRSLLRF